MKRSLLLNSLCAVVGVTMVGLYSVEGWAAELKKQTVVVANWSEPTQPESVALQYITDKLVEIGGGKITAEYFPNAELGRQQELYEQMQSGEIQICVGSASMFDTYCANLNPFSFPFIYPNVDAVKKSLNGSIGDAIREALARNNYLSKGIIERGNRQLTANKPVRAIGDLAGLKLRLPDIVYFVKCWQAMGANCVNFGSSELFTALQTGVCDAQENPTMTNYNRQISEVQKYYMITDHYVDFYTVVINKAWFDLLPTDFQNQLDTIIDEACEKGTLIVHASEEKCLKELEKQGMTIIRPDMTEFRKIAIDVFATVKSDFDENIYRQTLSDCGLALN